MRWIILCYFWGLCVAFKTIVIKPGGLKGFYMMGISKYIKDHYNTTNWIYYGSSAGAWNGLYLTCKNEKIFMDQIYDLHDYVYNDLYDLEKTMKKRILSKFTLDDFSIDQLNICVTTRKKWSFLLKKNIISDYRDLDDLVECCIASSHLPIISNGNFFYKYRNILTLDGGFFNNPYDKSKVKPDLVIHPNIWKNKNINSINRIHNMDIKLLLNEGYKDAFNHRRELDEKLLC